MFKKLKLTLKSGPLVAAILLIMIVAWLVLGWIFSQSNGISPDTTSHIISEQQSQEFSSEQDTNNRNSIKEVLVKTLSTQAFTRELSILGKTRYGRRVIVSALTEGKVIRVLQKEGEQLAHRTIIIELDAREAQAELNYAKSLETQRRIELDGFKELFNKKLVSETQLAESQALFESAKAQSIQRQIKLESTRVQLPFKGVLQEILVEEGDYVKVGQALAEVLDFSPFVIQGAVAEKDAGFIHKNQKAKVKMINGQVYNGTISYLSTLADESSRSFQVELSINNEEEKRILSGVSSTIILPITDQNAHQVPSSILEIDDAGEFGIKTIAENNTVAFHSVSIVKSTQQSVWVTGLPDTVTVIIRGQGFVDIGDTVQPVFKENDSNDNYSNDLNE